jgi:hypothetical protein
LRIDQSTRIERTKRAAKRGFKGMLSSHRQGIGGDNVRRCDDHLKIRKIVRTRHSRTRHHDGQIAKPRVFAQHRQEGFDDPIAEPFRDHDRVDIAGIEMLGGGLDRECAHNAQPFTKRDRKRWISAGAPDQKRRGIAQRVDLGDLRPRCVIVQSPQRGGVECANPQSGAQAWCEAGPIRTGG